MPFVTQTAAGPPFDYTDIYWIPPGMEFGGSRLATGYLVDAPAPVGVGRGDFGKGVDRLPIDDGTINSTLPANTATTSYSSYRGAPFSNFTNYGLQVTIETSSAAHVINRMFRYGPRPRASTGSGNSVLPSALDGDLPPYPFALWPGSAAALVAGITIWTNADKSAFSTTGSETFPFNGLIVRVDTEISSGNKVGFVVSWGGNSPGKLTDIDAIMGTRGGALARVMAQFKAAGATLSCHNWRLIHGSESGSSITRFFAPIFVADRQCVDFAFDVDFPAPLGNQRVVFSCETKMQSDSNIYCLYSERPGSIGVFPILTRRTVFSAAPFSGYVRTGYQRPGSVGYAQDTNNSSILNPAQGQWRDSGGAAGWRNCVQCNNRPVPAFHELDQAVTVGLTISAGADATQLEFAWGYIDSSPGGVGVPIDTVQAVSIGASPAAGGSVTLPPPPSLPAIPGMRYSIICRRKVSPAGSFEPWGVLYSGSGSTGATDRQGGTFCLPRVYVFDVRKQARLPSSADAIPVAHYGWSFGDYAMRPSSQPVPSGSWACAYVPAASNPWQINTIVSGVSGNPSYGSAWAWGNGYRWRVQLPQWDAGKPYVAASHLQNSNLGGAAAPWWKPSASITTADFVIWRMANSIAACGDDNLSYGASVFTYVSPSAKLFSTYEWRQSIAV